MHTEALPIDQSFSEGAQRALSHDRDGAVMIILNVSAREVLGFGVFTAASIAWRSTVAGRFCLDAKTAIDPQTRGTEVVLVFLSDARH